MISRRIPCRPGHDRYRRLALYIADAARQGEKVLLSWAAGGWSADDYELAIAEAELTQAANVRAVKEKTYHLLVSFRPEDEDKLTPEVWRAIEMEFAQALGLEEHQRHAGVHRNTGHLHLHVAYNLIHPERRARHEPFRDFWLRDKLCRALERKYGLSPDNGRKTQAGGRLEAGSGRGGPEGALAYEAHAGQESFFSYARRQADFLRPALAAAKGWAEVHQAFGRRGLRLKAQGAGLIVQAAGGPSLKASDLGRDFSKGRLEKIFGPFVAAPASQEAPEAVYAAAPLNQGSGRLWEEYKTTKGKRLAALEKAKTQEARLADIFRRGWEKKKAELKRLPMLAKHRRELMAQTRKKERTEAAALRRQMKLERDRIKEEYPAASWSHFLRRRAERGHSEPLALLRSRPGQAAPSVPESVAKLKAFLNPAQAAALKYRLDGRGVLIFTLPGGGSIRDDGETLRFSPGDEAARRVAEKLPQARWGTESRLVGGTLSRAGYAPPPAWSVMVKLPDNDRAWVPGR